MLGFIYRTCKEFKNPQCLLTLYYLYVYSKLSFGSVIWNPYFSIYINRLESVQKKFLKMLSFKMNLSIDQAAKHYKLLPLAQKRVLSNLHYVFKILNNLINSPFLLSCLNFRVPGRNLRGSDLLNIPYLRTNLGQSTPLIRMQSEFNSYCTDVNVFYIVLNQFKHQLKQLFLQRHFN